MGVILRFTIFMCGRFGDGCKAKCSGLGMSVCEVLGGGRCGGWIAGGCRDLCGGVGGGGGLRVCGETSGVGGHVKRLKTTDLRLRGQEKQTARVFSFVIYV